MLNVAESSSGFAPFSQSTLICARIRGGERPPRKVSSTSAVVRAVSEDTGGVGYVAMGDVTPAVKIIGRIRGGQVLAP